jgi:DNA modification methylase
MKGKRLYQMKPTQTKIINFLKTLITCNDLAEIKHNILEMKNSIEASGTGDFDHLNFSLNGQTIKIKNNYLVNELTQILASHTLQRTKYYTKRLIKGLSEVKTSKINDINLNQWKKYNDILTDSLWLIKKRDNSGSHSAEYWGNFIPQIPNQLLKRYSKQGEWVLDPFLGSGTTLIECIRLGRNGIGVELQKKITELAENNIQKEQNLFNKDVKTKIVNGDSSAINFKDELKKRGINSVQLLIMHPPYWDIIKFSNDKRDLSNAKNVEQFLSAFGNIVDNTYQVLDKNRYLAVVIGDKYCKGEWIPLGFYAMQEVLKRKYKLKSIIVKNFEDTTGKRNQHKLWRYRALVGGFYIFKHEYIFLFVKRGK